MKCILTLSPHLRASNRVNCSDMRIKSAEVVLLPPLELQRPHNHLPVYFLEVVDRGGVLDLAVRRGLSVFPCFSAFQ
jgi:hypothetical protein